MWNPSLKPWAGATKAFEKLKNMTGKLSGKREESHNLKYAKDFLDDHGGQGLEESLEN